MNIQRNRIGLGAVGPAIFAALQWRVLLLWLLGGLLPTLVVSLPMTRLLSQTLDQSVHSEAWARQFDIAAFADIMNRIGESGPALGGSVTVALVLALLLSPLLAGATVTAARSRNALTLGDLVRGGVTEYWRMFRLLLVAAIPFGIAIGLGSAAMHAASEHAEKAITPAEADRMSHLATYLLVAMLVIAHATVEAGRAQFAADGHLRSALKAWWRGLALVLRRPVAMLGSYLILAAIALVLVYFLGGWRIGMGRASTSGVWMAFVVTQLMALVLAWWRTARLFAFADITRHS